ncbi:MAG TPA: hypothetical protein EYN96_07305 [Candidatus Hydrogenedentes bacterium]|nr:hypothetical protein [Candidatus Hydrogenedentota bacterium]
MNSLVDLIDSSVLTAVTMLSIKGSVIIALVLFIQRLGRNVLPAQARYWLWIPALLCLLLPFSFATTWSPFASLADPTPSTCHRSVAHADLLRRTGPTASRNNTHRLLDVRYPRIRSCNPRQPHSIQTDTIQ